MNWLYQDTTIYNCVADKKGHKAIIRDVLMADFALPHTWWHYDPATKTRHYGTSNDLTSICTMRRDPTTVSELKPTLQCWTPSAYLKGRGKGAVEVVSFSGLLQFDFDFATCQQYNITELMQAVFDLPFIAFVGRSCSGLGFYALALIAEPERLNDYALHCFDVFERYGLPCDRSKGRNLQDLRYVSYDANMLIRENPTPLRIKQFKTKSAPKPPTYTNIPFERDSENKLVNKAITSIISAPIGSRFPTVQKWSYCLGGTGDEMLLQQINQAIENSSQYAGTAGKYLKVAKDCFRAGMSKPLNTGR